MSNSVNSKRGPHVPTKKEQLFGVIACTVILVGYAIYIFMKTKGIQWWFSIALICLVLAWSNYFPERIRGRICVAIGIGCIIALSMGLVAAMGITTLLLLFIFWQLSRMEDRGIK